MISPLKERFDRYENSIKFNTELNLAESTYDVFNIKHVSSPIDFNKCLAKMVCFDKHP